MSKFFHEIIIIIIIIINARFFFQMLALFNSSAKLEIYIEDCGKLNDCAIKLPSENDK